MIEVFAGGDPAQQADSGHAAIDGGGGDRRCRDRTDGSRIADRRGGGCRSVPVPRPAARRCLRGF